MKGKGIKIAKVKYGGKRGKEDRTKKKGKGKAMTAVVCEREKCNTKQGRL